MIASGLPYLRHCCTMRLDGKSQVGNMYVSAGGNIVTPCCVHHCCTTHYICLCEQACTLCTSLDRVYNNLSSSVNNHFIINGMTAKRFLGICVWRCQGVLMVISDVVG